MRCFALLCAVLLLAANTASAASFDCAKASTKIEKMICSDPGLSKLDDELGAAYTKALKASSDPAALKQQQRDWMNERNKCNGVSCLSASYKQRLAGLMQKRRFTTIYPPDVSEFDVDCNNAKSKVEKIICKQSGDHFESLVAKFHGKLLNALKWALMRSKNKQKILDSQRKWQNEVRDACADGLCLTRVYPQRTAALEDVAARPHECYELQPILGAKGKVEPIKPVCQIMEKNLNQFCDQPPMVCQIKVAPEFQNRITFPKWKPLDPEKSMPLIKAFICAPWVNLHNSKDADQRIWEEVRPKVEAAIAAHRLSFSKANLDVFNLGRAEPAYRLDYGTCRSDNPQLSDKASWNRTLKFADVKIFNAPDVILRLYGKDHHNSTEMSREAFYFNHQVYSYSMFGYWDNGESENSLDVYRYERWTNPVNHDGRYLHRAWFCRFKYHHERGKR